MCKKECMLDGIQEVDGKITSKIFLENFGEELGVFAEKTDIKTNPNAICAFRVIENGTPCYGSLTCKRCGLNIETFPVNVLETDKH